MRAAIDSRLERMRSALRVVQPHEWLLLVLLLFITDRYRWLMDDAFIYFRYADNLLFLGRGLVFNPGEFVEGYSSPLWMLLLLPLRATELDYYTLVRALALVCAAGYGAALVWLNRRISPRGPTVNFPLAASAAHYGITTHFSSGLETPLVQLLAPAYAAALICPRSRWLQALVALAPLVRPECAVLSGLYLVYAVARTRQFPWLFIALGFVANGAWIAFRVLYYADFLPNTFYLKNAADWRQGRVYWLNVSDAHHWPLWIAALIACAVLGRRHLAREDWAARACMALAALIYGTYVMRIGGDMLYHRYAALPVCLLLCASAGFIEAALARLSELVPLRAHSGPGSGWLSRWTASLLGLGIALSFGLGKPAQLPEHPFVLPEGSRKWQAVADPNWHRRHSDLEYTAARASEDALQRGRYAAVRESASAKIVVTGWCYHAWRQLEARVVHDYGLTDPVLARLPRPFGRPGHKLVQVEAAQLAQLRREVARARARPDALASAQVPWYALRKAPRWVRSNRPALAVLEQKLHNRHELRENLALASTKIVLR
jgi:signal transduction histidine kinase